MPAGNTYGRPINHGRSRVLGPIIKGGRALLGQSIGPDRRTLNNDPVWTESSPDGPLGFWPLSDTGVSTAIERVADRTMTLRNSPTLGASGLPRGGVTFNGSSQAADTASTSALSVTAGASWSVELWLRYTTSGTTLQTPFAWRGTTAVATDETTLITVNNGVSGRIEVNSVNALVPSRVVVGSDGGWNDGKWHHVVATAAVGGDLTLYIDGVSRGTNSATRSSSGGGANSRVCVGANIASSTTFSQFFAGSVSNVAIYSGTVLAANRVLARYRAMADSVSL